MVQNNVEIVYGIAAKQTCLQQSVKPGTTVLEAIQQSGMLQRWPEIDLLALNKVGIFGKFATLDTRVNDNDRIEIYRPLDIDPKQARLLRAARSKLVSSGDA
jgi:putative ubiquitin-RnfH superfamily antitoxin RatB of RatAB toxin-antitoxin module